MNTQRYVYVYDDNQQMLSFTIQNMDYYDWKNNRVDNYKYDNFYRLQADEKFAETLVEWLKSPRIEEKIFKEAGIDPSGYSLKKLAKSIKAEKMSSQVVAVSFSSPDKNAAMRNSICE